MQLELQLWLSGEKFGLDLGNMGTLRSNISTEESLMNYLYYLGKLTQYSRLRSEFLGDKNSSPWSGPPLSEFPKLQLGGKDHVV